jgi:uncharacterized OB-fold protein
MRDPRAPDNWQGTLPVTSRYTFGLAGERFFRALKEQGQIFGTYCPACNHTYVPAQIYCERCLAELTDWQDIGLIGEVYTFTLLHINLDGSPKAEPEIIAFVRMGDGGLVHRLGNISIEDISIGMQVQAVLKPQPERQGSILDIIYFEPVGSQSSNP